MNTILVDSLKPMPMYCHNCIGTPLGWQEAVIEDSGIGCSIVRNSQKVGPDSRFKFVNTAVFFGKVLTKNVNSRVFFVECLQKPFQLSVLDFGLSFIWIN